jgi:hypothetical protein
MEFYRAVGQAEVGADLQHVIATWWGQAMLDTDPDRDRTIAAVQAGTMATVTMAEVIRRRQTGGGALTVAIVQDPWLPGSRTASQAVLAVSRTGRRRRSTEFRLTRRLEYGDLQIADILVQCGSVSCGSRASSRRVVLIAERNAT